MITFSFYFAGIIMGLNNEYTLHQLRQHRQCFFLVKKAENAAVILLIAGIPLFITSIIYYQVNAALGCPLAFLYAIGIPRTLNYIRNKCLKTMKENPVGVREFAIYEDTYDKQFPTQAHALVLLERETKLYTCCTPKASPKKQKV